MGVPSVVEFNPYSFEYAHNPYPIYRALRDDAPVVHNEKLDFWALSRYADVSAAHLDPDSFSSAGGVTIEGYEKDAPLLIVKDPPVHTWHRKIVARVFTPRRIADLEPFIRERAGELLDRHRDADEFDIVNDFAVLLPLDVISELIGIPVELRDEVHRLSDMALGREEVEERQVQDTYDSGTATLVELFLNLVQDRRANPRDDIITIMAETPVVDDEGNETHLSDIEVAVRFQELAIAGHETVGKVIPNGVIALAWYPDQRRELTADYSLMKNAVEEVLRWDPPSHLQGRTTTRDVTMHGVTIPAGSKTMLLTASANHDEREYENPELFDIRRDLSRHMSFGYGIHVCLGAHLARLEMRIAFEELLARYPDFHIDGSRAVRHVLSNVRGLSGLPLVIDARN